MIPHPPETSQLRGHVIVVGLHGIGLRVVEQLLGIGQQVVVIDDGADDKTLAELLTLAAMARAEMTRRLS